jgi:hypothetical protein
MKTTHLWRSVMKDSSKRQRQASIEKDKAESLRVQQWIRDMGQGNLLLLHLGQSLLQKMLTNSQ